MKQKELLLHSAPMLSTKQMIEVDRLMVEEFGIDLVRMMENAGRSLAELTRRFADGIAAGKKVSVACGSGGNAGGGLVAARFLSNWGAKVTAILTGPKSRMKEVTKQQLGIVERLPVGTLRVENGASRAVAVLEEADFIIDAVLGYNLAGNPRGAAALLIEGLNRSRARVLSLDVPSGMDVSSGRIYEPAVRASATLTLALPKRGFDNPEARPFFGKLYLADIGVPPSLYRRIGLNVGPLFSESPILSVVTG
jgi:NAD(P)H-hydrate epimerase